MADLKGLKRICMSCGARFYDLNKKPIICPSCNVEFTGEIKVKARRGRLPVEDDVADSQVSEDTAAEETEEDELEEEEADDVLVSLEDIEDGEDDDDIAEDDDDDLDVDEDLDIEDDLEDLDDDLEDDIIEDEEDK